MTAMVCWLLVSRDAAAQTSLQPARWDANLTLATVDDLNPDPRIVEINLEARVASVEIKPGEPVELWTYNGGLPGPLIRARVGDRLIVHFQNKLPQPTTVHWHGLRIPIQMDGVPGHSQPEVLPGQSFTYDFVIPDAGLYWYHPHVMSAAQVGFGLYGALIVDDPDDGVEVKDELVLVLSDLELNIKGTAPASPDNGGSTAMAFGREGDLVLANGRLRPTLTVRNGAPQRWRIVNAAKSRFFSLSLDGQPFTKIGADGGLQEYPEELENVVLAPGERADVIVAPKPLADRDLVLLSGLYNRGYGSVEYRTIEDVLSVAFSDMAPYAGPMPARVTRRVPPVDTRDATEVHIDLTLGRQRNGDFIYGINEVPFAENKPIFAKIGETQIWTIRNKTLWSHPFHLHGFFFQVLDDQGQPVRPLTWKDTVNVPYEQSVRVVVRFDERPGAWMYHCHILDHADGGLMGILALDVIPGPSHGSHR